MNPEVKEEIIEVLKVSLESIKKEDKEDIKSLRDISNKIINSSSLFQDENIITAAVMSYSLSKIYSRSDYRKYPTWNLFSETTINSLRSALFALQNNNLEIFEKNLRSIFEVIDRLDNKLKTYIKDALYNSQIARGSRLHEHGISLGRTAQLLGINQWELSDYIGRTGIADVKESQTMDVEKRLKVARGLFKK